MNLISNSIPLLCKSPIIKPLLVKQSVDKPLVAKPLVAKPPLPKPPVAKTPVTTPVVTSQSSKISTDKKTCIILDLDNTLLHTLNNSHIIPDENKNIKKCKLDENLIVYARPYLNFFIETLCKNYDVGIWTFGTYDYACLVLQSLGINILKFKFIYARDYPPCNVVYNTKDLKSIKKLYPEYEQYILVDDNKENCSTNVNECIWVNFFDVQQSRASTDNTLLKLANMFTKPKSPIQQPIINTNQNNI